MKIALSGIDHVATLVVLRLYLHDYYSASSPIELLAKQLKIGIACVGTWVRPAGEVSVL